MYSTQNTGDCKWQLQQAIEHGLYPIPMQGILTDYPELGARMCPCGGRSDCSHDGKRPKVKWKKLHKLDKERLRVWVSGKMADETPARPQNYSVRLDYCGEEGFVGVDLDLRHGGKESLEKLEKEFGPLPATVKDSVEGSGTHLYFDAKGANLPPNTDIEVRPGLQFKSGPTLMNIPPSTHHSGKPYRWADGCAPWNREFAKLPDFLLDLAWQTYRKSKQGQEETSHYSRSVNGSGSYGHIYTCSHEDIDKRVERCRKYLATMAPAILKKGGDKQFYRANWHVIGFDLPADYEELLVNEFNNTKCFGPFDPKQVRHKLECARKNGIRGFHLRNDDRHRQKDNDYWDDILERIDWGIGSGTNRKDVIITNRPSKTDPSKPPSSNKPPSKWVNQDILPMTDEARAFSHADAERDRAEAVKIQEQIEKTAAAARADQEDEAPPCENPYDIYLERKKLPPTGYSESFVYGVGCGKRSCRGCWHKAKRAWKRSIQTNLGKLIHTLRHVYAKIISNERWPAIRKRIRRAGGDYYLVRVGDGLLVVTTVDIKGWDPILPQDAIHRLFTDIDAILPGEYTGRAPISSSRDWQRGPDTEPTRGYRRVGKINKTREEVKQILDEEKIHYWEYQSRRTGRLIIKIEALTAKRRRELFVRFGGGMDGELIPDEWVDDLFSHRNRPEARPRPAYEYDLDLDRELAEAG